MSPKSSTAAPRDRFPLWVKTSENGGGQVDPQQVGISGGFDVNTS